MPILSPLRFAPMLCAMALGASVAQAQDATSRQLEAAKSADMTQWMWRAQQGRAADAGPTQAVLAAIQAKDCPGAVKALNAGLAKPSNEVFVLAGAMFQSGLCVKPNWDRAVGFFERAHGAGSPVAAARLSSGYASGLGATPSGPDYGTALWWAAQAKTPLPSDCSTGALDADKFVAALNRWPSGQLQACVYAAGVMSSLQAELASPDLPSALQARGELRLGFVPGTGQLEVSASLKAIQAGRVAPSDAMEREVAATQAALIDQVKATAQRSMSQLARPKEVPAAWRVDASFLFGQPG